MRILSVYPLPLDSNTHDASASLVSELGVLFAYEEERLSRFQYSIAEFPEKAASLALAQSGVAPDDIDLLVTVSLDNCWLRSDYPQKLRFIKDLLLLREDVDITCLPHHLAHTSLAVLTSPFKECSFITMDGGGDGIMGHCGVFKQGEFKILEEFDFSPAVLFGYLTCLAGFSLHEEGKLMGLSGYGQVHEGLYHWLGQNFRIKNGGAALEISPHLELRWDVASHLNEVDADTFRRHKYHRLSVAFDGVNARNWQDVVSPMDIAATGQRFFEELVTTAAANVIRQTGISCIALGGGAFQNVVLNGKLPDYLGIPTYVSMAPHDAGLSLGAALYKWHESTGNRPNSLSAYLGPSFDSESILSLLSSFALEFERPDDLTVSVASALESGKVVGWFQGRAEFGARALGARSVLADPRTVLSKARLNQVLKRRDWFMPYAPTILEEFGAEYFENFRPSPYMNTVFRVLRNRIAEIPAAVHVDGTCRAQSVTSIQNPILYKLIRRFFDLTGIPMVLNTSFNRHGVPIVATPRQAVQHLLAGNIDLLTIEDFLVYPSLINRRKSIVFDEIYYIQWEHLRWAAVLLKSGKTADAQDYIKRSSVPITVTDRSFLLNEQEVWCVHRSIQDLQGWWSLNWSRERKT